MANDAVFTFGADTTAVENSIEGLSGKISGFGKTAALALGGLFAGQQLVTFFNNSTAAAIESEKAVRQFNFALRASGVFSEEISQGFQRYAQSLQDFTGVADETILRGATTLMQVGELSGETLNRTIVAALDLAAARGIEASEAFEMLARAAQGNVMPFSKLGVEFAKNATEAEKFASVLGFIEGKFTGAARESLNGYEGALKNLSNTWGDLQENIGKMTTESDFSIAVINALSDAIKFLQFLIFSTIVGVKNWVAAFGFLAESARVTIEGIGLLDFDRISRGIDNARNSMYASMAANEEWLASTVTVAQSTDTVVVPAFKRQAEAIQEASAALKALREAQGQYEQKMKDAQPTFKNFVTGFKSGLAEMSVSLMQLGKMVANTFVSGFSNAFASVGKALVNGQDAMSAFGNAILQMLGTIAIQMGQFYIAAGIAAMFLNPGSGIGMIVAGGALSVLGGVLQALGGGSGGAPSSASSGGVGASQPLGETDTSSFMNEMTQDQERISPNSGVQVVIQGNVLDRRETGLAIAEIINETFNTNGVTITANA